MEKKFYKASAPSGLREPLVNPNKEVELKVDNKKNDDSDDSRMRAVGSITRKDLPPSKLHIAIPVNAARSRCWCLTFRRKSVFTRTLESVCRCPWCIVFLWQIVEEIRWIINRVLLFRPFDWLLNCTCPHLLQNNTVHMIVLWVGMSTFADLLALAAFLFYEIGILISGLNDNGGMKATNTSIENFRIFGLALGTVAIDSFAVTWFLAQRNTLWNLFMGLPFERGIIYHRIMARFSITAAFLHMVALTNYWSHEGGYANVKTQSKTPPMMAGWLALGSAVGLLLFSLETFRRKMFELFIKMHWMLFLMFLYFIIKHDSKIWYDDKWNLFHLSIYFWVLDLLWRMFTIFSCNKRAHLTSLKCLPGNVIEISFSKHNFVYESGQYVFICLPALDMTEWHPFSIASCPQDDEVKVCVRVLGDWTKKLQVLASKVEHASQPETILKDITVFIEGPYGSPSIPLHYYRHIVFISGGIGITPMQVLTFFFFVCLFKKGGGEGEGFILFLTFFF
ncbi:respiratory burst oxidase, partial [Reticulomyxa filosa]